LNFRAGFRERTTFNDRSPRFVITVHRERECVTEMSAVGFTNPLRAAAWFASTTLLLVSCAAAELDGDIPSSGGSGGAGGSSGSGGSSGGTGGAGGSSTAGKSGASGNAGVSGSAGVAGASGTNGAAGSAGSAGSGGTSGTGGGGQAGSSAGTGGSAGGAGGNGAGGASGNAGAAGSSGSAGASGASGSAGAGGSGGASGSSGTGGASSAGAAGGGGKAPPIGKKFVGNIDARNQIRSDFNMYWNQFSAENAGKWGSVERTRDQMNWSTLDTMYEYAQYNGIIFKHHNFVWGRQQPEWLSNLSASEQRAEVEEWIRLYCERYPDTPLIDVVNEPPPHTTPAYVAALGGAGSSGYDWIAQAFIWAHQYCPNAILILNDYNNIEYESDVSHTIDIANRIKDAGAPIHAIGAQAHDAYRISTNTVRMYIDRIASQTGLPVYISEYDIPIADDNQQRDIMQSQFTMFWDNENVEGITLWGYIVGMTWVSNSGLMTSSGQMRPAMTWLTDFLEL
jgi:endo-1,4-beta-xylanase